MNCEVRAQPFTNAAGNRDWWKVLQNNSLDYGVIAAAIHKHQDDSR